MFEKENITAENHGDLTTKKLFKIFEIYNFVIYNNKKAVFVCGSYHKQSMGWIEIGKLTERKQEKDTRNDDSDAVAVAGCWIVLLL